VNCACAARLSRRAPRSSNTGQHRVPSSRATFLTQGLAEFGALSAHALSAGWLRPSARWTSNKASHIADAASLQPALGPRLVCLAG